MPNYKEIARLKAVGQSNRAIADFLGLSSNTVNAVVMRIEDSGLPNGPFHPQTGFHIFRPKTTFTTGLKIALDILNKEEQTVVIDDAHRTEIKEYLDLLDLTVDVLIETIPINNEKSYRTVIAQPGLRYAQAAALVNQMLRDKSFQDISAEDRKRILERILNEIRGRMMEDIVVMETMRANPDKEVFRLQFAVGEFEMVVVDPESVSCEIYEIKHSSKVASEQSKNLVDMTKVQATEFRFGKITKKAVIYKGPDTMDGDVYYLNVEDYLRTLNAIN